LPNSEDKMAAAILRDVENRVVWLAAFLVIKGSTQALGSACAKAADEALDEYQRRFPAITPPG
jgi:hypothetical protein